MTREEVIAHFKKLAKSQIGSATYKLWTVGNSSTVHVTCLPKNQYALERIADKVISDAGSGERYATFHVPVGQLGNSYEASFCFKV